MLTKIKIWARNILQTAAFWGGYFIFAGLGLLASVACTIPSLLFGGHRSRLFGQGLIYGLFRFFVSYLVAFGLLELEASELSKLRTSKGLVIVANHPSLLDIVLIISQLPRGVCLMKESLARNIVLFGTAWLAGYIRKESSLAIIKKCRERIDEGSNLLIFPEGTRTVNGKLLPFKLGFALVAAMSRSEVQTIFITTEGNCLGKGCRFFHKPCFPVRFSLRLGKRFKPDPGWDAKQLGKIVEDYFREHLIQSSSGDSLKIQLK